MSTSLGNTKRGRAAKPEASIYTSILEWRACKKKTTQIFVWPPELDDGWAQRWIYGLGALLPSKKKVALGRLFTPVSLSFVPKSLLIYARLDINYFLPSRITKGVQPLYLEFSFWTHTASSSLDMVKLLPKKLNSVGVLLELNP